MLQSETIRVINPEFILAHRLISLLFFKYSFLHISWAIYLFIQVHFCLRKGLVINDRLGWIGCKDAVSDRMNQNDIPYQIVQNEEICTRQSVLTSAKDIIYKSWERFTINLIDCRCVLIDLRLLCLYFHLSSGQGIYEVSLGMPSVAKRVTIHPRLRHVPG